jgi:hypothetical protein
LSVSTVCAVFEELARHRCCSVAVMSTRAEKFKADAQRTGSVPPSATTEAAPQAPHGHAAKKATYARETQPENGQPSRKSTRKSANRAKTDTGEARAEQMRQNTPEAQYARSSTTR